MRQYHFEASHLNALIFNTFINNPHFSPPHKSQREREREHNGLVRLHFPPAFQHSESPKNWEWQRDLVFIIPGKYWLKRARCLFTSGGAVTHYENGGRRRGGEYGCRTKQQQLLKELYFNNNAAWVLAATCGCSIRLYNWQLNIPEQRRWLTSPFQLHIACLLMYDDFIQIPNYRTYSPSMRAQTCL